MKKIVIGCLFLVAFNAQGQGRSILDILDNTGGSVFRNVVTFKEKENAIGTPYLNDLFMSSQIAGTENVFQTRYNAHMDEVEVRHDDSVFVIPKEEQYNSIFYKLAGTKLQLMRYNGEKDEYIYGYLFELFAQENFGIYKREKVSFQEARPAPNAYATAFPPKYTKKNPEFYLKLEETKVVPFPKSKKALLNLFPNKEGAISDYLKGETISFKEEGDLVKLTKFLATI